MYSVCLFLPRHPSLYPSSFSFSLLLRRHVTNFASPHTSYHTLDQHASNRVNQAQFKSPKLSKTNLYSLIFLSVLSSHRWTSEWTYFLSSLSHRTSALSVCSVIQITAVLSSLDTSMIGNFLTVIFLSPQKIVSFYYYYLSWNSLCRLDWPWS